jgi:hypothetical protein
VNEVEIYNLALSSVGTRARVALPTESSREAQICNLWFGPTRDQVLRGAHWPSARTSARLSVLAERDFAEAWVSTDPEPDFTYAYALPSDFLYPRHTTTFSPFKLGIYAGTTPALMSNEEEIILHYTSRQTSPSLWDIDLAMAIVHGLAAYIALPLHGKAGRARESAERANELITAARVKSANADQYSYEHIPQSLTSRGYAGFAGQNGYIYPYGSLITATGVPSVS